MAHHPVKAEPDDKQEAGNPLPTDLNELARMARPGSKFTKEIQVMPKLRQNKAKKKDYP